MYKQEKKIKDQKKQGTSNNPTQWQAGQELPLKLVDNRYEAALQRKLQKLADKSPQSTQLKAIREMINDQTAQFRSPVQKKVNQTGLSDTLKSGIERLSGISMDHVKVYFNSDKPARVQAHAYTQGAEIHVAPGQERHLPHEAWHVVQQAQGRVKPSLQMNGVMINDDVKLEKEADIMGSKALAVGSKVSTPMPVLRKAWSSVHFPAQLYMIYRGMKAETPGGDRPMKKDALKYLGVRPHDVPAKYIVAGKVVHHAGMSTGTNKYPPRTFSNAYSWGNDSQEDQTHADFLWTWRIDTDNLPASLQAYDDQGNEHRLIEPSQSGVMTLAEFRDAVKSTQADWERIDP